MNHTDKNCTRVLEEDKEKGYGWGLEIKASPRKGLTKQQEEMENIRTKRTLFITKPTEILNNAHSYKAETISRGHVEGISLNGKAGYQNVVAVEENIGSVEEGVQNEMLEMGGDKNNKAVICTVGTENEESVGNINEAQQIQEVGDGAFTFHAGAVGSVSRRHIKAKRRVGPRVINKETRVCNTGEIGQNVTITDQASKRKMNDIDFEMVDSDAEQKRSCLGDGVINDIYDSIAEVGVHQPREQQ